MHGVHAKPKESPRTIGLKSFNLSKNEKLKFLSKKFNLIRFKLTRPKNIINIPENFISKILFKLRNSPIEVVVRANNKKIIENERVKIRVFNININEESLASFFNVER